jgi:glucose/mannose transport system substrate-binding protein
MNRSIGPARTIASALLVAGLSVAGSATVRAGETAPAAGQRLTLYHWWTSPSESAAINALIARFKSTYPDVAVSTTPFAGPSIRPQFSILTKLAGQNQSPDAFQSNGGYAAQLFVDAGLLSPVDDIWSGDKLEPVIPGVIRDLSRFDGHYFAIPINVHRTNVLWYNKALLDRHKINPATLTDWPAFFSAAEKLRAAGIKSPVQMSVTWTAAIVFESIVAGLGSATYEDWINGNISRNDARFIKAFAIFKTYLTFVNDDHGDLGWDQALKRVMAGDGAFCMMGDWADGEFRAAGLKYGKEYGSLLSPGTTGMFGVGLDMFLRPRGAARSTSSSRWLSVAASRDGQDAFNPLKGSIPARTDADPARYESYQRAAIIDLKTAEHIYPHDSAALPEAFNTRVYETLGTFMIDRDPERAVRALADTASKLKQAGKYKRVWSLK